MVGAVQWEEQGQCHLESDSEGRPACLGPSGAARPGAGRESRDTGEVGCREIGEQGCRGAGHVGSSAGGRWRAECRAPQAVGGNVGLGPPAPPGRLVGAPLPSCRSPRPRGGPGLRAQTLWVPALPLSQPVSWRVCAGGSVHCLGPFWEGAWGGPWAPQPGTHGSGCCTRPVW